MTRPRRQRGFILDPYSFAASGPPASAAFTWDKVVFAADCETGADIGPYEWLPVSGTPSPSTTQKKFGAKSWPGGASYPFIGYPHPFFAAQTDLTADFWLYPTSLGAATLVGQRNHTSGNGWEIYITSTGKLGLQCTGTAIESAAGAVVINAWQHVRMCYVQATGTAYLFVGGTLVVSGSVTITNNTSGSGSDCFMVAGIAGGSYLTGYIDEIVVSREALSTVAFTPPSATLIAGQPSGYSGWNSSDKGTGVVVSANGRCTLLNSGTFGFKSIRGAQGRSAGKLYFEVSLAGGVSTAPDLVCVVGVANSSAALTQFPGQNADSWGFYSEGARAYYNGSFTSYGARAQTVGVLVDFTAGSIRYKTSTTDPATDANTGLTGTLYPMWSVGSGAGVRLGAINTGGTAFLLGLPSGASAWH